MDTPDSDSTRIRTYQRGTWIPTPRNGEFTESARQSSKAILRQFNQDVGLAVFAVINRIEADALIPQSANIQKALRRLFLFAVEPDEFNRRWSGFLVHDQDVLVTAFKAVQAPSQTEETPIAAPGSSVLPDVKQNLSEPPADKRVHREPSGGHDQGNGSVNLLKPSEQYQNEAKRMAAFFGQYSSFEAAVEALTNATVEAHSHLPGVQNDLMEYSKTIHKLVRRLLHNFVRFKDPKRAIQEWIKRIRGYPPLLREDILRGLTVLYPEEQTKEGELRSVEA